MTNKPEVCPQDGIKHRVAHRACLLLLALAAVPGIFSLSGCSGLVGAQSSTGGTGALSANPSTIIFGDVSVGSSATQSLSLTNTGTQAVNISATISGSGLALVGGSASM